MVQPGPCRFSFYCVCVSLGTCGSFFRGRPCALPSYTERWKFLGNSIPLGNLRLLCEVVWKPSSRTLRQDTEVSLTFQYHGSIELKSHSAGLCLRSHLCVVPYLFLSDFPCPLPISLYKLSANESSFQGLLWTSKLWHASWLPFFITYALSAPLLRAWSYRKRNINNPKSTHLMLKSKFSPTPWEPYTFWVDSYRNKRWQAGRWNGSSLFQEGRNSNPHPQGQKNWLWTATGGWRGTTYPLLLGSLKSDPSAKTPLGLASISLPVP